MSDAIMYSAATRCMRPGFTSSALARPVELQSVISNEKTTSKGKIVKPNIARALALVSLIGICAAASADPRVDEVWTCKISDGKTMDNVRAANSKWVVFINANVKGGDITSHIVTPIVGDASTGTFIYVDSFPSLASWSVAKQATDGNKEGEALDAELAEVANCSENRLYSSEAS